MLLVTRDEDGDFIVRDLTRPGCATDAPSIAEAFERLTEVQAVYDAMAERSGVVRGD